MYEESRAQPARTHARKAYGHAGHVPAYVCDRPVSCVCVCVGAPAVSLGRLGAPKCTTGRYYNCADFRH